MNTKYLLRISQVKLPVKFKMVFRPWNTFRVGRELSNSCARIRERVSRAPRYPHLLSESSVQIR